MEERKGFQPFIQVLGAGVGYTFKDNGQERDANLQSVTPSLGLKYTSGSWSFLGMAGPQFRWKQEDQPSGPKSDENFVGAYVQLEAFRWQEEGIFHAIASYTDIDGFMFGRVRKTWLVHKTEQSCCSWYVGGDLAGDRKSTRLNSSHLVISYAVFCLKKKTSCSIFFLFFLLFLFRALLCSTLFPYTTLFRSQLEAFRWQEEGIFHAIASYTDIDGFMFGRVRKTWLVHKTEQSCCSWYVGGDLA